MFAYTSSGSTLSFATFIITRLLQSKSDLAFVERELLSIWNASEFYKDKELLVSVYHNFLNDIYQGSHINFFVQTHRIIDQVCNGDDSDGKNHNLTTLSVRVERVVDIVQHIFKTNSALSLFENTTMLEIPYSQI